MARGLCPVAIEAHGLGAALEDLVRTSHDVYGVPVELAFPDSVLLEDVSVATNVYYVIKEALTNSLKHAAPTRAWIRAEPSAEGLRFRVEYDGSGVPDDTLAAGSGGMGLHIMSYRAQAVGGSLSISRRRGGGTRVTLVLGPESGGLPRSAGISPIPPAGMEVTP